MSSELSATMRDYLVEIYRLSGYDGESKRYVSTSALADVLDVSAPAVNRMVTKLKEMNLLLHEPYQGIALTEAGRREALIKLRYHRIAEAFLVNVMGFDWHEIHEEAQRMSTGLSEILVQRMSEMAGEPSHCPHGEPIPALDGTLLEPDDIPLSEARDGDHLEITRVRTREADRLQYIAALGLVPGAQIELIHAAPFHGPLQIRLNGEYRIIGHNLAELILAKPV